MSGTQKLQQDVSAAWAKLPTGLKARLEPQILAAHNDMLHLRARAISSPGASIPPAGAPPPRRDLLLLHSLLNNDPNGLLQTTDNPAAEGVSPHVASDGQVYFGDTVYDATDPGWGYTIIALAATLGKLPPFNGNAQVIQISDDASFAILGDWGGWNAPAQAVAAAAKGSAAKYFIHLGDTYYAGTNTGPTLKPYETTNFLDVWPGPANQSFALNSNHDMYAHATGYFGTTLAPGTAFTAQQGASFFALFNSAFRIVGLDSAYFSSQLQLYDQGTLGTGSGNRQQAAFLQDQARLAAAANQNLIVLTHHNGLSVDGSTEQPLWQEVAEQLDAFSGRSVCWYWGHQHVGAVYQPRKFNDVTIYPRCCGHGCIPWGIATALQTNNVVWFEQKVLGPKRNYFVTNGYATLMQNGASLTETFYDQTGRASWSGTWPPTTPS